MLALMEKLPVKKILFMIVLLFVPLFLFYLSVPGIWDEDESVYAEISRQMVLRHDLVGTYFNYEPRFDKPPLNFWINVAFYKVFGMTEFTSRIGSTIFGFLCLILMFLFGQKLFNKRTGILAALILGTGFLFFIETQLALIDTTLTFFIGLTLYFFYQGLTENKSYFYIIMGIPLGLGILAKGPVAFILASAIGFIFWLFQTFKRKANWRNLFNWQLLTGFLIAAAICLPWYFAMWSRYGMAFIQNHFGYHMIARFTRPIEGHGGEWYFSLYYIIMLFFGFMPWSAYIVNSYILVCKRWSESNLFFLLSWSIVTFAFFTIAQTKLPGYTLPLLTPIALIIAYWLDYHLDEHPMRSNPWIGIGIQILIISGLVGLIVSRSSELPSGFQGTVWIFLLLPVSLILTALLIIIYQHFTKNSHAFFKVPFFTFYLVWALFLLLIIPVTENFKPVRYLAVELRQHLTAQDKVISYLPGNFTAPFYTRHKVIFVTDDIALTKYYNNKSRIFAFVEAKSLKYLKEHNFKYYQLGHFGSGYLIANQPLE